MHHLGLRFVGQAVHGCLVSSWVLVWAANEVLLKWRNVSKKLVEARSMREEADDMS